jgi:hypothetical protein
MGKIVDPTSPSGEQMIRNSAFAHPLTQGDPPPPAEESPMDIVLIDDVPHPTKELCYKQAPDMRRCDRATGHKWLHTWEAYDLIQKLQKAGD